MTITLDEKTCLKKNLTLQEALIAVAMSMSNFNKALSNMKNRGIVDSEESHLTSEWEKTVNGLIGSDDNHLKELAAKMKECFPKGKKPGTVFYFRCNEKEVGTISLC